MSRTVRSDSPKVGVLCFDLSPASASTLNLLSQQAADRIRLKAFPLFRTPPSGPILFPYRPSSEGRRYVSFDTPARRAPETMILNLSMSTVLALVRESDIVCLLGIQGMPAFLAAALARIAGKPVVAINQTMGPDAERNRASIIRTLKGWILRNAVINVAQTPATLATLHEVYGIPHEQIMTAPWDGAAHEFGPVLARCMETPKSVLRQRLGIAAGTYVIVYCGTLIYLKGVDILVQAFSEVVKSVPDSLLLLAGEDGKPGGQQAVLEQQTRDLGIASHVRFLGGQPWEELAKTYLVSDVFVLPSRKDVWPKVLMEAALAGLPLVTTSVCGSAGYLVRHLINGFVVPANDHMRLAEVLISSANQDLRQRMSLASREMAQEYMESSKNEAENLILALEQGWAQHSRTRRRDISMTRN